jgi:hypothetical protein
MDGWKWKGRLGEAGRDYGGTVFGTMGGGRREPVGLGWGECGAGDGEVNWVGVWWEVGIAWDYAVQYGGRAVEILIQVRTVGRKVQQ